MLLKKHVTEENTHKKTAKPRHIHACEGYGGHCFSTQQQTNKQQQQQHTHTHNNNTHTLSLSLSLSVSLCLSLSLSVSVHQTSQAASNTNKTNKPCSADEIERGDHVECL